MCSLDYEHSHLRLDNVCIEKPAHVGPAARFKA